MASWLLLAASWVLVDGGGACPTAAAVSAKLSALLPEAQAQGAGRGDSARIQPVDGGLRIELRNAAHVLVAVRRVDGVHGCDELADVAAVVIAAWEAELHSEALEAPSLPLETATERAAAEAVKKAARVEAAEAAEREAARQKARQARYAQKEAAMRALAPRPSGLRFEVDAALLGSVSGGSLSQNAAGAMVEVLGESRRFGFGLRLGLRASDERTLSLAPGLVRWARESVTLGANQRFSLRWLDLDFHVEGLLALVSTRGVNFTQSFQSFTYDEGVSVGMRANLRLGALLPFVPFVDVTVAGWPLGIVVEATNVAGVVELPRIEALLSVGIAVGQR